MHYADNSYKHVCQLIFKGQTTMVRVLEKRKDVRFSHFSMQVMQSWNSCTCLFMPTAIRATSLFLSDSCASTPFWLAACTSKPAVNAFSPAPERTMARMSGERERVSITVLNSSHMGSKKALSFEGRLIWTCATKGRGTETRKYL